MHLASAMGSEDRVVELLAADGTSEVVDARNGYGHTPLTHAAAMGHERVVRVLLAAGANPEHRGYDGCTPLMVAGACEQR